MVNATKEQLTKMEPISVLRTIKGTLSDAMRNITDRKKEDAKKDCKKIVEAAKVFIEKVDEDPTGEDMNKKSIDALSDILRITEGGKYDEGVEFKTPNDDEEEESSSDDENDRDPDSDTAFAKMIFTDADKHSTTAQCLARILWKLDKMEKTVKKDVAMMRIEVFDASRKLNATACEVTRIRADIFNLQRDIRQPGTTIIMKPPPGTRNPFVANLMGQNRTGPPSDRETADQRLEWFDLALKDLCRQLHLMLVRANITGGAQFVLAFPKFIGCGLAGGEWQTYEQHLQQFATQCEKHFGEKIKIIILNINGGKADS
eukprot:g3948.t1